MPKKKEEEESEEEEEVIEFEDEEASEMDHDPLDDPQECCGQKMSCSRRAVRKVLGLTLVAIAAFMFSLVTLGVKTSIHDGMDFCGVLGFRALVSWVINFVVMLGRRIPPKSMLGTKMKVPLLLLLGLFGAIAQLLAFYSVSILSMADANVYMMTSPVFVFLLARIWLGDPVDYVDVISAIVCIIGVMFVSKPSAIFGCDETDDCGLTQYCTTTDGSNTCADCGTDLDSDPRLLDIYTTENFTAYQICRGVQDLTDTSLYTDLSTGNLAIVGPVYCDLSFGLEASIAYPAVSSDNCHESCLATTDCGFFTTGFVDSVLTCVLYLGETCNTTNTIRLSDVDDKVTGSYDVISSHPPELYRMLGEYRESDANQNVMAIIMAIVSALAAAVTYCIIRKIGHGIDGLVCVNYFSFISTIIAFIGGAFQGVPLPRTPIVWAAVVGMGVAGFLGQYSLTVGFQLEKPGPASVIRYMDVIFVFIWDAAFFATNPEWNNYVGALLVILAAIGIVLNKTRKQKLGIKQQKPLINFGDCACCCRPQDGDDGGAEDDASKPAKKKDVAKRRTYITDADDADDANTSADADADQNGDDDDGLETELESTI